MNVVLQHFRQRAALALAPFFLEGTHGDSLAAQEAAATVLDDYYPADPKEMQLAAEIVAASFATLACLRSAVAGQNLPVTEILKLQGTALALERTSRKATKALEMSRKRRQATVPLRKSDPSTQWNEDAFKIAIDKALAQAKLADAKIPELLPPPVPVRQKPKLHIVASQPMTPNVLRFLSGAANDLSPPKHGPH